MYDSIGKQSRKTLITSLLLSAYNDLGHLWSSNHVLYGTHQIYHNFPSPEGLSSLGSQLGQVASILPSFQGLFSPTHAPTVFSRATVLVFALVSSDNISVLGHQDGLLWRKQGVDLIGHLSVHVPP